MAVAVGTGLGLTGVSASEVRAQSAHQFVMNRAATGNLAIRPAAPLLVQQQHHHGTPLVRVRAAHPVVRIGPRAVQDRIPQAALAHLARHLGEAGGGVGAHTMEALQS